VRFTKKHISNSQEEDPDGVMPPMCTCRHAIFYHVKPVEEVKKSKKKKGSKKGSKKKRRR
jgi:hypothetical protein